MAGRKKKTNIPLPVEKTTVYEPLLPFPYVTYPGTYGTIISFSETPNGQRYYCECFRGGPEAYNRLVYLEQKRIGCLNPEEFERAEYLPYKKCICHRCLKITPSVAYCHSMYGTIFTQRHGWYVNQEYYRRGVSPNLSDYLPDVAEARITAIIDSVAHLRAEQDRLGRLEYQLRSTSFNRDEWLKVNSEMKRVASQLGGILDPISKEIANVVRADFGIKPIGFGWVSESLLYNTVCLLCPNENVVFHYRPDWLDGLELDIFLPERRIGIEYQGQQHYIPVKHWGGEKALEAQRERDKKKARLCRANGVLLRTVTYKEDIVPELVAKLIMP